MFLNSMFTFMDLFSPSFDQGSPEQRVGSVLGLDAGSASEVSDTNVRVKLEPDLPKPKPNT